MKREGETSYSMAQYTRTTCSKVIQSEAKTLRTELQRLLDQNLIGIYLHGSLALGGFQPGRSDIDVIVLTAQRIDLETKCRCIELLLRISKMPCPLDIRFLVQQDLFPFQHPLLCDLP
jgi:predicted nucleotidyltransferase